MHVNPRQYWTDNMDGSLEAPRAAGARLESILVHVITSDMNAWGN